MFTRFMLLILGDYKVVVRQDEQNQELLRRNQFGFVLSEEGYPVICGCGGSAFLCMEHASQLLHAGPQGDLGKGEKAECNCKERGVPEENCKRGCHHHGEACRA